jgi:hypothetical protein
MKYMINGKEVSEQEFRSDGASKLKDMLREGRAPYGSSDGTFLIGKWGNVPATARKKAESLGASVNGRPYFSGLARFHGDPEAFVDSKDDIRKLCERRGWSCEGAVNVKAREVEPKAGPVLAPDIVESLVDDMIDKDPGLATKHRQELREAAIDKHGPKWGKPKQSRRKKGE